MASPKRRRHSLYLMVGNYSRPLIVKAPDYFMPWATLRQHIFDAMKSLGIKVKDVSFIEGLSGFAGAPDQPDDDPIFRRRLDLEFAKPTYSSVAAFHLFAWNEEKQGFDLVRKGQ